MPIQVPILIGINAYVNVFFDPQNPPQTDFQMNLKMINFWSIFDTIFE